MLHPHRFLRLALSSALAAASLAVASPAMAASPCGDQPVSQPFLTFLDPAQYTPVGDAGLEQGGAGWTLSSAATIVDDQEPWLVGGSTDERALELPAGASALTPPLCVTLAHPDAKLFARSTGLVGLLLVDVVVRDGGLLQELPAGVVTPTAFWSPSLPLLLLASLTTPLTGGSADVQLRLTSLLGTVRVDDVYVDPYKPI